MNPKTKTKPANFICAISFSNVFAVAEKWKITFQQSSDAIASLKEFITTLICLYLHSYFIMLRDCGRNETIYIYKKCCECLLHQSSAASFRFQIKMLRSFFSPVKKCLAELFIFHPILVFLLLLRERNKESSLVV